MNVEVYESSEAFQIHEEMNYTKVFLEEMGKLVEAAPIVYFASTLFKAEHSKSSL
jgi:quinol monooxygenase YgiN